MNMKNVRLLLCFSMLSAPFLSAAAGLPHVDGVEETKETFLTDTLTRADLLHINKMYQKSSVDKDILSIPVETFTNIINEIVDHALDIDNKKDWNFVVDDEYAHQELQRFLHIKQKITTLSNASQESVHTVWTDFLKTQESILDLCAAYYAVYLYKTKVFNKKELSAYADQITQEYPILKNSWLNKIKLYYGILKDNLQEVYLCLRSLTGHTDHISKLQPLLNGNLASASEDNTIKIWDGTTGQCLHTLTGHTDRISKLQPLPDGNLASASKDNTIKIWNPTTGECLRTLTGHTRRILELQLLPNGNFASASYETIKIWDVTTGECLHTLTGHTDHISKLQLLPNGNFASASYETIKIWNIATGECLHTLTEHTGYITHLQLLPNGNFASASYETIKIWDVTTGQCLHTLNTDHISKLQPLPDGNLASVSYKKTIKIWDVTTGQCLHTLTGHTREIVSIQLLPNGNLASASYDYTIKIWDVTTGQCLHTLTRHTREIHSIQLLPNGNLASASYDNTIKIWKKHNPYEKLALDNLSLPLLAYLQIIKDIPQTDSTESDV